MSDGFVSLGKSQSQTFDGFVAEPKSPNGGSVVILQEIFGVNENIQSVARSFAAEGFFSIAPDLYWRQKSHINLDPGSASDREQAKSLMQALDVPLAIEDALIAARYLTQQTGSNGKVGCVGYCLGGKLAFLLATKPQITCAVSYYGTGLHAVLNLVTKVTAATLLHIAETDPLCPPSAQKEIATAVAGVPNIETIVHPGVGHAFARQGYATYDEAAARRANAVTLLHFKKALIS